jgi:hypothetical protein
MSRLDHRLHILKARRLDRAFRWTMHASSAHVNMEETHADMHAGGHDQPQDGKFDLGPGP